APAVDLVTVLPPELVARELVERGDERLSLVIPLDDDTVPVEDGRLAFADPLAHLLVAEILLPERLAVHVVRVEAERVEERVDVLAVGHGRRGRPRAPLRMRAFVRRVLVRRALPDRLPGLAIERHHDELVRHLRARAARLVRSGAARDGRHGGEDEHLVAPNDRRAGSAARYLDLPADVLRLAPLEGRG